MHLAAHRIDKIVEYLHSSETSQMPTSTNMIYKLASFYSVLHNFFWILFCFAALSISRSVCVKPHKYFWSLNLLIFSKLKKSKWRKEMTLPQSLASMNDAAASCAFRCHIFCMLQKLKFVNRYHVSWIKTVRCIRIHIFTTNIACEITLTQDMKIKSHDIFIRSVKIQLKLASNFMMQSLFFLWTTNEGKNIKMDYSIEKMEKKFIEGRINR